MAYIEDIVRISAADDGGFVVMVQVKKKKKKKDDTDKCCPDIGRTDEKTILAKDIDEVKIAIEKVLPDMKPGGIDEDDFSEAFKGMKEES